MPVTQGMTSKDEEMGVDKFLGRLPVRIGRRWNAEIQGLAINRLSREREDQTGSSMFSRQSMGSSYLTMPHGTKDTQGS